MKNAKYFILLSFLVLFFSSSVLAQNKDEKQPKDETVSSQLAVKLQQKILLSKDQTEKVTEIIEKYLHDKTTESLTDANSAIVKLLDSRQKIKFDIVKNDWWKLINENKTK